MTILAYLIGGGIALYVIFGTNLFGKSCPNCRKTISNEASVCPHCTREI
jgi:predicted amidophosphoribosyltransferase